MPPLENVFLFVIIITLGFAVAGLVFLCLQSSKQKKMLQKLEGDLLSAQAERDRAEKELTSILEATARSSAEYSREERSQVAEVDPVMEKSAFISRMSQDLRTPINSITGLATVAKRYVADSDRVEDCLERIDTISRQLMGMVEEVLDVNKLQSGGTVLVTKRQKLQDIVKASVASFAEVAKEKHVRLTCNLPEEVPTVLVDEARMVRLLGIVIGNAVNYTEADGKVIVTLMVLENHRDSAFFAIKVSDTGCGISPDFLARIFEPFAREDETKNNPVKGMGLGLTSARQIARLMSGDITAVSQKGEGSTFTITVRLAKVFEQEETKKEENVPQINRRVLLVEDNPIHTKIATDILGEFGLSVDQSSDGKQALDMLFGAVPETYAMVFMDIKMPTMDGYEATRKIRESDREDLKNIPIVALTGEIMAEDIQKALNAGMNAHVAKPIEQSVLRNVVKKFIAS